MACSCPHFSSFTFCPAWPQYRPESTHHQAVTTVSTANLREPGPTATQLSALRHWGFGKTCLEHLWYVHPSCSHRTGSNMTEAAGMLRLFLVNFIRVNCNHTCGCRIMGWQCPCSMPRHGLPFSQPCSLLPVPALGPVPAPLCLACCSSLASGVCILLGRLDISLGGHFEVNTAGNWAPV